MRFWDSSAIVPLVSMEEPSTWAQNLLDEDPAVIVWALSPVEVHSALARRRRDRSLTASHFSTARGRAKVLFAATSQVVVLEQVVERAVRALDVHALRAADALQLAAALLASREHPQDLPFVTLDERLAEAADREGFPVFSWRKGSS